GEHNGTFRGNNLAFVTAKAVVDHYWSSDSFALEVQRKSEYLSARLQSIAARYGAGQLSTRGRGMVQGINCVNGELAGKITRLAFHNGLIIETSGADHQVVKFLCPLTISDNNLKRGIDIVESAIAEVFETGNRIAQDRLAARKLAV